MTYQKILLLPTHSMSDYLFLTTVAQSIRVRYPEAQIDILTTPQGRFVFKNHKAINNHIKISPHANFQELKAIKKKYGRYDLVIDEEASNRTFLYSLFFGKSRLNSLGYCNRFSFNWLMRKAFFKHSIKEKPYFEHKMSRMARLLKAIQVPIIPKICPHEETLPIEIKNSLPNRYLIVHPPSSHDLKQWPIKSWGLLVQQLIDERYFIVLTGSPSEHDMQITNEIMMNIGTDRCVNLSGKLSLAQTASLIKNGHGFIGPDCGIGHIASGYPSPIITLMGVAPPSKWAPWPYRQDPLEQDTFFSNHAYKVQTTGNVSVVQSNLSCVPCNQTHCAIKDEKETITPCLQAILPTDVLSVVKQQIPL